MAESEESFYDRKWASWIDFKRDFDSFCKESHQVFAALDSRTVEKQNARLSADTPKYKEELKYAYMRFGCIHYGKKYTPKCRTPQGERPVQR